MKLDWLIDLIYPNARCVACNEPRKIDPGAALCDDCVKELDALRIREGYCPRCLSPKRADLPCRYCAEGGMAYISAAFSPFRYHSVAQRLVVALKFQGVHLAADPLVHGMIDSLDGRHFDAIVPIPLHAKRLRERGFDQARLLCDRISAQIHVPVLPALTRIKNSKPQSCLSHTKRRDNVKDIFRVELPANGMRLLLVDDVRTTGNTARACAKALIEAGASEICLLTATVAAAYDSAWSSSPSSTMEAAFSAKE